MIVVSGDSRARVDSAMRSAEKLTRTVANADRDVPNVFSSETDRCAVEEAFVVRFVAAAALSTTRILERAGDPCHEATFAEDLKRIRNPLFARVARILEKTVPTDAEFGPFQKN